VAVERADNAAELQLSFVCEGKLLQDLDATPPVRLVADHPGVEARCVELFL
jgi:hypothetical protein